jgi:hypothetical protein
MTMLNNAIESLSWLIDIEAVIEQELPGPTSTTTPPPMLSSANASRAFGMFDQFEISKSTTHFQSIESHEAKMSAHVASNAIKQRRGPFLSPEI